MLTRKYLSFLYTFIIFFLSASFIPSYTNPKNKRQKAINQKSWLFGAVLYMYWQIFSSIIMAFWSVHEFFFSLLTSSYLPPLSLFADFPPFNYLSICTSIRRNQCFLSVLLVLLFTLNKKHWRPLSLYKWRSSSIDSAGFFCAYPRFLSIHISGRRTEYLFLIWTLNNIYFKYRRAFWWRAKFWKRFLLSSISSSIKTHSEKQSFHPVCSSSFLTVVCNLIQREVLVVWKRKTNKHQQNAVPIVVLFSFGMIPAFINYQISCYTHTTHYLFYI